MKPELCVLCTEMIICQGCLTLASSAKGFSKKQGRQEEKTCNWFSVSWGKLDEQIAIAEFAVLLTSLNSQHCLCWYTTCCCIWSDLHYPGLWLQVNHKPRFGPGRFITFVCLKSIGPPDKLLETSGKMSESPYNYYWSSLRRHTHKYP